MRELVTIRIGVIGAGTIGQLRARTIRDSGATTLAAVCDVAPEAARAAAAGQAAVVSDLEAFFDVPMDAVVISSPIQLHEEQALRAFERGLHVLCEKPLSNTVASARRIVDAAQAAGRVLAVGFNLRYYPSIKYVREIVDRGTIGEVDHIRLFGGHDGLANFRAEWQYRAPISGGGATMDVGIHISDLGRHFLGDITEVYGVLSERVWRVPGSEDNALAVFRNAANIPATYQATWIEWKGYQVAIEVYGTLGMVRGCYAPMRNLLITHERPGAPRRTAQRRYPEIMVQERLFSWTHTARKTFEEELTDFVSRIGGGQGGRLADGHDGLRALEVSAALRESTETREAVHLAPLGPMRP
jgi:predicted dehydrogenase